jgi:hypothetical protein
MDDRWHGEEAQCVPGRRCIKNDRLIWFGLNRFGYFNDGDELVDPRRRKLDQPSHDAPIVARIDSDRSRSAAREPLEHLLNRSGISSAHLVKLTGGINRANAQARGTAADRSRRRRDRFAKDVAKRMRWIGRYKQDTPTSAGRDGQRGCRSTRGFSHTSLAAKHKKTSRRCAKQMLDSSARSGHPRVPP